MKRKLKKGEKAYMQLPVEVKTIDKELGTLEAVFSTQDIDRHGDTVLQEGWDLKNFKKNPVILNSHNYGDAAEVIGKASNVRVEQKKLQGKITFAVNENPKAKVIFDLYAGGFLNAFSVGFIPSKFKENKDGSTDWFTIEEAELLEVSAVSVPANARALAKAKGIDITVLEKDIDEDDSDEDPIEDDPNEDTEPEEDEEEAEEEETDEPETPEEEPETPAEPAPEPETTPEEVPADPEPTPEPEPTPAPVQTSYKSKVAKAIHSIESEERRAVRKAAEIIQSLLDGDKEGAKIEKKTLEQIRKRKVNQAIRMLIKAK